ncbi:hypothetical protein Ancab_012493 [Ancistrocladus abbreviatus]
MAFILPYAICFSAFLPFMTINAQTNKNITLGSSLTAGKDDSSWVSPSADFAFGFQQVETGSFLLAIWYNKIPERTIIWSANRDDLAGSGSKIELTTGGEFVLRDPAGQEVWKRPSAGPGLVAYAAMLDSGNFVLAAQTGANIWQSFDEPTYTIVPSQLLKQGGMLVSPYSETNYSQGRFQFQLQTDGNLCLYQVLLPSETRRLAYWATMTMNTGYQVLFNESGIVYEAAEDGSVLARVFPDATSAEDFYLRATLDYDGVFRKYVYPKSSNSSAGTWPKAWSVQSFIPSNICLTGAGCGLNSFCKLGDDQRPKCTCPPGYVFSDANDELNGCKRNFVPQKCEQGSEEQNQFDLEEVTNAQCPDSMYDRYVGVDEDWCREACMGDCFCAAATFGNGECRKIGFPFYNGRIDPSIGVKTLIKTGRDNTSPIQTGDAVKKKHGSKIILFGSVALGSLGLLIVLLLAAVMLKFNQIKKKKRITQEHQIMPRTNLASFSYKQLEEATGKFKDKVGQGAFSTVYKGTLNAETGDFSNVAVKKLHEVAKDGEKEFEREIRAIAGTNHRNLVKLVGFCSEGPHRLLVYEFMINDSLARLLLGEQRPSWLQRIQIALHIARGLNYLHEECSNQIIHCDIKPQNILLDDNLTARIADFGLAKLLKKDQTRTFTGIRGTKGYVAPEWFRSMPVTVKVDVYSYGILLLELICCRKCFDPEREDENEMVLADWAYDCYKEGRLDLLVENDEDAQLDMKRVKTLVMIAFWCIQEDPSQRPSMKKVIQMMEGAMEVSVPPNPSPYINSDLSV